MCRPCSSMRPCRPRPLAPLPPSRQPYWYTVMLSYLSRQPGRLNSMAVVMPATPPPRITTRGSRVALSASGIARFPEDVAQLHHEIKVEPERQAWRTRALDAQLARERLAVERLDMDVVVVGQ